MNARHRRKVFEGFTEYVWGAADEEHLLGLPEIDRLEELERRKRMGTRRQQPTLIDPTIELDINVSKPVAAYAEEVSEDTQPSQSLGDEFRDAGHDMYRVEQKVTADALLDCTVTPDFLLSDCTKWYFEELVTNHILLLLPEHHVLASNPDLCITAPGQGAYVQERGADAGLGPGPGEVVSGMVLPVRVQPRLYTRTFDGDDYYDTDTTPEEVYTLYKMKEADANILDGFSVALQVDRTGKKIPLSAFVGAKLIFGQLQSPAELFTAECFAHFRREYANAPEYQAITYRELRRSAEVLAAVVRCYHEGQNETAYIRTLLRLDSFLLGALSTNPYTRKNEIESRIRAIIELERENLAADDARFASGGNQESAFSEDARMKLELLRSERQKTARAYEYTLRGRAGSSDAQRARAQAAAQGPDDVSFQCLNRKGRLHQETQEALARLRGEQVDAGKYTRALREKARAATRAHEGMAFDRAVKALKPGDAVEYNADTHALSLGGGSFIDSLYGKRFRFDVVGDHSGDVLTRGGCFRFVQFIHMATLTLIKLRADEASI